MKIKPSTYVLLGVAAATAYYLWRRANDPARILANGDIALTQAAALQAAGQPVSDAMKAAILRAHGPRLQPGQIDPFTGKPYLPPK